MTRPLMILLTSKTCSSVGTQSPSLEPPGAVLKMLSSSASSVSYWDRRLRLTIGEEVPQGDVRRLESSTPPARRRGKHPRRVGEVGIIPRRRPNVNPLPPPRRRCGG